jgi:hypothetical protein
MYIAGTGKKHIYVVCTVSRRQWRSFMEAKWAMAPPAQEKKHSFFIGIGPNYSLKSA